MKGVQQFDAFGVIVDGTDADLDDALIAGALDAYVSLTIDGKVTRLPPGIARLSGLKELTLASRVETVDPALFSLTALQRLSLQSRKITALPAGGWGRLVALETLEITTTGLLALPEDLGDVPRLGGSFDLRLHKFKALPESFGRLSHVTALHAPWGIKSLPTTMAGMTSLRMLSVHKTALGALPESIGGLPHLVELHANDARLKSVPESLGNCLALEELNLGENKLSSVPSSIGRLPRLQSLSLDGNPITAIPDVFPETLEFLRLRGTRVSRLPAVLASLPKLRMLTLSAELRHQIEATSGAVLAALGDRVVFG